MGKVGRGVVVLVGDLGWRGETVLKKNFLDQPSVCLLWVKRGE